MSVPTLKDVTGFSFSRHTLERIEEREIDPAALLKLLEFPEKTVRQNDGRIQYWGYGVGCVVDPVDKAVISVLIDGLDKEEDAKLREDRRRAFIKDAVQPSKAPKEEPVAQEPKPVVKAPQKATQGRAEAPGSFGDTTMEAYLLFWQKKYREMGFK